MWTWFATAIIPVLVLAAVFGLITHPKDRADRNQPGLGGPGFVGPGNAAAPPGGAPSRTQSPTRPPAGSSPTPTLAGHLPMTPSHWAPADGALPPVGEQSPAEAPGRQPLTASFATVDDADPLHYTGVITIANPGSVDVTGWTVVITLPALQLSMSGVSGAQVSHDGTTWTFTPVEQSRVVRAQQEVFVRFRVTGSRGPTSCSIDGRPCEEWA